MVVAIESLQVLSGKCIMIVVIVFALLLGIATVDTCTYSYIAFVVYN